MSRDILTRRGLLKGAGVLGCSLAAHPLMTTVTFASAPWEATLGRVLLKGPRPISSQGEEYLTKLLGYLSPSNRCLD